MSEFRNRFAMAFFIALVTIGICGCKPAGEPEDSDFDADVEYTDNLLSQDYVFFGDAQWDYWRNINLSSKLPPITKGSVIWLEFENWTSYEHGKNSIYNFNYADWKGQYSFTNIKLYGSLKKTSWSGANFEMPTNKFATGQIKIKLTASEAELVAKKGLIVNGYGLTLKSVKCSSKKYNEIDKSASLETQYEDSEQKRKDTIDYYQSVYSLPIIYVTTKDEQDVKKKEYYDSIVDLVNCDSKYALPDDIDLRKAGVKVRGNSTASDEYSTDKPYRIKFEKKNPMLGLHGGKKYKSWVLLKTGWSIACDYLGFNLAHEIYKTSDFDYYASDGTYVHVIINGNYKGLYLLCEQNQVNKGRVDVYEPKENETRTDIGYMIELDNYTWEDGGWPEKGEIWWHGKEDYHFSLNYSYEGDVPYLTDVNNVTRKIPSDEFTLKNDVYSDSQVKFISKYVKGVWDICYSAIEKGKFLKFDDDYNLVEAPEFTTAKQACDAVIDLESLCNEMILEELVRDNDVGAGSLYMAVDFTKGEGEKYHKFTFECPWDFNWAYSTYAEDATYYADKERYFAGAWQPKYVLESYYEGRSNVWFILFNKTDWFQQMEREKWERIGKENLISVVNRVEKDLEVPVAEAKVSQTTTDWTKTRIDYIDKKLWK